MVDREIYILTILVGTSIFILGFYVGSLINQPRINEIKEQNEILALKIENINLGMKLLETFNDSSLACEYINEELKQVLKERMKLVEELQRVEKLDQSKFELTKRKYTLSLINIWLLMREREKFCGNKSPVILYFYEIGSEKSREQGKVLDHIVYKFNQKDMDITILAMDKDFDEPALRILVKKFNVTVAPTLIIGDKKFSGFTPETEIENAICEEFSVCYSEN